MSLVPLRRHPRLLGPTERLRQAHGGAAGIAEAAVAVQPEVEQSFPDEAGGGGPRQEARLGWQPQLEGVVAHEPIAEGVEGLGRHVGVAVGHQLIHPPLELGRRLLREGQGEDLRRPRPLGGDQPGDPPGDDPRLARARTGDHDERSVAVGHGAPLRPVQTLQDGRHGGQGDRRARDRAGRPGGRR